MFLELKIEQKKDKSYKNRSWPKLILVVNNKSSQLNASINDFKQWDVGSWSRRGLKNWEQVVNWAEVKLGAEID